MSEIVVDDVSIGERSIEYAVDYSRDLRRFFDDTTFSVSYDVDVSDVPRGVATIPVLAQICPVAWATDSTVVVDTVDAAFAESLKAVRDTLSRMYPAFIEGGDLRAERVTDQRHDPGGFEGSAQLFSGGVDSLATYVRHREDDPALVAIQGWVVGVDEDDRWERAMGHVDRFARQEGCRTHGVTADISGFLDHTMLNVHYKHHTDGGWYSGVGHGIGLLGVCAPLCYSQGYGVVHMGSTHWDGFELESVTWPGRGSPWGSHPDIDDNVRWAGTRGHHDAFEITRQDKLELLADYARETGEPFVIRTCTYDDAGGNCNRCEKCVRTATGLLLAGVDPNDFGYRIDADWYDYVIERFETNDWALDEHVRYYWEDIQAHLPPAEPLADEDAAAFVEWLAEKDFADSVERSTQPTWVRLLRVGARNVPYEFYEYLYPVYDRLRPKPYN
jgi:hypothetical protein